MRPLNEPLGRLIAERSVRPSGIVVNLPGLNNFLGFLKREELMFVEALVAKARVEALDQLVLPQIPWRVCRQVLKYCQLRACTSCQFFSVPRGTR